MGYLDVQAVRHQLSDGRILLDDVNFRVGEGAKAALVGANGAGKTTLLRLIAGDLTPQSGAVARTGGLGVMRQFIGSVRDETAVQDFLVGLAAPGIIRAWADLTAAELAMMEADDEKTQLRYAQALSDWGDAGGYDAEVLWDTVTVAALGMSYEQCKYRELSTLSGGEQKRLALEALLRGPAEVLLLDEPDNYLDVPGKQWLEERLRSTSKTVLFVSHDRELLAKVADRVATVEGGTVWVHGGGFGSYHEARTHRHERMAELRRRWEEEHARLVDLVRTLQQQAKISPDMASRYRAMQTRLAKFEAQGPPPELPEEQNVTMRLRGGRTGVRAVVCEDVELTGLMKPFSTEIFYGERLAVLGSNGAGKSHFLRLLAGEPVRSTGSWKLGARVVPGLFAQTHAHPEWLGRTLVDLLWHGEPSEHRPRYEGGAERGGYSSSEHRLRYEGGAERGGYSSSEHRLRYEGGAERGGYSSSEHRPRYEGGAERGGYSPGRPGVDRGRAMAALRRYELNGQGDQDFATLSGGQQARFQILLLELSGATLLLLDEPTDNLDVLSAEALEEALESFDGTVISVTHDRWFARTFDRFLVFGADGEVRESTEPVFTSARVSRPR